MTWIALLLGLAAAASLVLFVVRLSQRGFFD
jgi:hypothetical protein